MCLLICNWPVLTFVQNVYVASILRQLSRFQLLHKTEPEGDIVPGTVGNLCLDVRNSKVTVHSAIAQLT